MLSPSSSGSVRLEIIVLTAICSTDPSLFFFDPGGRSWRFSRVSAPHKNGTRGEKKKKKKREKIIFEKSGRGDGGGACGASSRWSAVKVKLCPLAF
jgi:hypothetical protein